jgi:uncharacterized membrane protein
MNRSKWSVGAGSVLLGLGLGGFFAGVILHQILQWHHMLSAVKPIDTVRGLEINTRLEMAFSILGPTVSQ